MKRCPKCNRVESDEALKFCRVDGATLFADSSSIDGEAGTVQLGSGHVSNEIETSILPHRTDANINRATASTTVLPAQPAPSTTRELSKPKRRRTAIVVGVIVTSVVAALSAALVDSYLSKRSGKSIQSIAVMPFVNESGNADFEYLSDGMTETLINSLSQLPNLSVKARSTVFHYKGKGATSQQVGSELSVKAVLNGRVTQNADQLTLSLELVDTRTGDQIWGEQYNRKTTDLVVLQNQIARDVASRLRTKLSNANAEKLAKTYTENTEAYNLYLQGRFFANKRTPKDSRKAIDCFQQAVRLDPNYAVAYTGLAISYAYLTIYGNEPASETFPRAHEFALRASQLDSSLAEPHILLGLLKFLQEHDFAGWEHESQLALMANSNSSEAHRLNGLRFIYLGRFDEALVEIQRTLEIEPLSATGNINYSIYLFYAGRIEDCEAQMKRAIELAPDFWFSHYYLFNIYRFRGNYAPAIEELAKSKDLRDETEAGKLIRASFAKGGWPGFLQAVTAGHAPMKMSAYNMAGYYAELGDKDRAFAALNEAVEADQLVGFLKIDPFMGPLRDDPRFQPLLKRVGFPP